MWALQLPRTAHAGHGPDKLLQDGGHTKGNVLSAHIRCLWGKKQKIKDFLKFVCLEKKESTGAERAHCQMQIQASLPKATGLLLHDALVGWLTGLGLKQRNSTTGGY